MLDKLLANLEGVDLEKVGEAVEAVWEDRDKIGESVNLVWDHKDEFLGVIEFFQEHREDVLELIQRLPELLGKSGAGLHNAGEAAVGAAALLAGSEKTSAERSASGLTKLAATVIDKCTEEMRDAAAALDSVRAAVAQVKIPTIQPTYAKVGSLKVISGLDFGEESLTEDIADRIDDGASRLGRIADQFEDLSEKLEQLSGRLAETGDDLAVVGGRLQDSGETLQGLASFGGSSATRRSKPRR